MGSVTRKEQRAELHRLEDEAAHRDDRFLEDASGCHLPTIIGRQASLQLVPDALIRPVLNGVEGIALEIQALDLRRPRTNERKTASVVGVNQLRCKWRRLGQYAEPAERVIPEALGAGLRRNTRPTGPVEPVTPGDEVARELARGPAVIKPDAGFGRIEIPDANVADVERDGPASIESCLHQVSDDFVLGVQRDRASAREVRERDAM